MVLGLHLHHGHGHRLNATVPGTLSHDLGTLSLDEIKLAKIRDGGYRIVFRGEVPPHHEVRLLLGNSDRYFIDITGGYRFGKHKHRASHLSQLLDVMDRGSFWGRKIPVRVAIYSGGRILIETLSPPRFIECPLEPLRQVGIEEIGAVPGLRYTGKHDASGETKKEAKDAKDKDNKIQAPEKTGTILSHAINGKYFFIFGGMFETDTNRRGFDCTTYVGAAGGLEDGKGQGGTGETVAVALGGKSCEMEHKHPHDIERFFADHSTGTYVMWSHGHVVFVKQGFVHEFTDRVSRNNGYQKTKVGHWLTLGKHHKQTFSIREVQL
jgi:hypothetical protein